MKRISYLFLACSLGTVVLQSAEAPHPAMPPRAEHSPVAGEIPSAPAATSPAPTLTPAAGTAAAAAIVVAPTESAPATAISAPEQTAPAAASVSSSKTDAAVPTPSTPAPDATNVTRAASAANDGGPSPNTTRDPSRRLKALDQPAHADRYPGAELQGALRAFAHVYHFPIVIEPDVIGTLRVEYQGDGTVRDELDTLGAAGDFFYEEEGNRVRIKRREIQSYYIEYPTITRNSTATMTVSVSGTSGSQGYGGTGNINGVNAAVPLPSPTAAPSANGQNNNGASSVNQNTFTLTKTNNMDYFQTIGSQIGGSLQDGEKIVFFDPHSGLMQIRATRDRHKEIRRLISDQNDRMNQSVEISVEIYEVRLYKEFNVGLDWAKLADSVGTSIPGLEGLAVHTNTAQVNVGRSPATQSIAAVAKAGKVNLLFQALSEQGEVRSKSNPKIQTLTNQTAAVVIGENEPFFGLIRSTSVATPTSTTGASLVSDTQYSTETDTFGTILEVTPTVYESGLITMDVQPVITALLGEKKSPDGSQSKPITDIKEAPTILQMYSGETKIVGGFIYDTASKSKNGVPFLSSIPKLGALFSTRVQNGEHTEVVIAITAKIMPKRKQQPL